MPVACPERRTPRRQKTMSGGGDQHAARTAATPTATSRSPRSPREWACSPMPATGKASARCTPTRSRSTTPPWRAANQPPSPATKWSPPGGLPSRVSTPASTSSRTTRWRLMATRQPHRLFPRGAPAGNVARRSPVYARWALRLPAAPAGCRWSLADRRAGGHQPVGDGQSAHHAARREQAAGLMTYARV